MLRRGVLRWYRFGRKFPGASRRVLSLCRRDMRSLGITLMALCFAALVGCFMPPPLEVSHARILDAVISVSLAVGIWSLFRVFGRHRLTRTGLILNVTASVAIWGMLLGGLMVILRAHYGEKQFLLNLRAWHNYPPGVDAGRAICFQAGDHWPSATHADC